MKTSQQPCPRFSVATRVSAVIVVGLLGGTLGCEGKVSVDPSRPATAGTGGSSVTGGAGNGSGSGAAPGAGAMPGPGPAIGAGGTSAGNGGAGVAVGSGGSPVLPAAFSPGPSRLRRLTTFEYRNSVIALLGPGTTVTTQFAPDDMLNNLTALGATQLSTPQTLVEQFEKSALTLAESLVKDTARRTKVVTCTPAGAADEACLRTFVTSFGRRAFRRPLTTEEVTSYVAVGKTAMTALTDFWGGVQYALAAILESPSFLYRTEFGEVQAAAPTKRLLNGYELGTRLAFLVSATTPDDPLLDAATGGALATPDGLKQQLDRLMATPRSQETILRIFGEMLGLAELETLHHPPAIFPAAASPTLGASMRTETQTLLQDIIFTRNADYREFFTTTKTFLNAELAKLYGVPAPAGATFAAANLPANGPRAGYLGQASFLALNGKTDGTSPTLRGRFIYETLLCNAVPAPPPGVVTELPDQNADKTLREQLKLHQTDPTCGACHRFMDPLGLALEHFDAIGSYRETDRNMVLDVTGTLNGVSFNGAKELGQALAESVKTAEGNPEATDCLVRNLLRVATGHLETPGEQPAVAALSTAFTAGGFRVRSAVSQLVMSEAFRYVGQPD